MYFKDRLQRAEHLASAERLGPSEEEKELARQIRRNPRLRRVVAFSDNLPELTDEERTGLTDDDIALLKRYYGLQ